MIMRRVMLPAVLALLIYGVSVLKADAAGQVVTQEAKEWAIKTIAGEKAVAAAPARNTLVVLYFLNRTGRVELDPLQKGMTLMLLTDLSQVPDLQLVERIKLQALAEELGLGSSGLVDQASAPRVGKLVGARFLSGGDFVGGKEARFDTQSRLLDVASTEIPGQFSLPGTIDDILATEKELVFKIVDTLKISLKSEVAKAIRKPCSISLKALDSLFRGVDASDRGEYQQAGELYSEALKADPDVCAAAMALQELVQMGKYSAAQVKGKGGDSSQQAAEGSAEIFAPASATADIGAAVSSQVIQIKPTTQENLPAVKPQSMTPVTIRATFP